MRHKFNFGDRVKCLDCDSNNCEVEEVIILDFDYITYIVASDNCGIFTEESGLELVE